MTNQKGKTNLFERQFFGTTVIGERGQTVIPAEARHKLGLKSGDKLLVFGMGGKMISFSKISAFEEIEKQMTKRLDAMRKMIKKAK